MPTQNYDGSWVGDDGQPTTESDVLAARNDASYNSRVWGDRSTDGPAPKPGSYDTGGLSPDVVAKLLQQPGVRAGIAYFAGKGERPNLNKIAALDQQVIPGYKNMGNEEVEDHSLRNMIIAAAAVGGAGAFSGFTGFGSGLASMPAATEGISSATALGLPATSVGGLGGGAAATTGAGSTLASLAPTATGAAPSASSTLSTIVPDFITSNAPVASSAIPAATAAITPAVGATMSSLSDGIPDGYGNTSTNSGNPYDDVNWNSLSDAVKANNPQMIPNGLSTNLTPEELAGGSGSTISKLIGKLTGKSGVSDLSDITKLLGGLQSGIKSDRTTQGFFAQNYDKNAIDAQTAANQARGSALQQLAQSKYLLGGGYQGNPQDLSLNGKSYTLPTYGMAPTPASDAQKAGAKNLQGTALATLAPGGTYTPQPLSSYATPGPGETATNYGATISGLLPSSLNLIKGIFS